MTKFDEYSPGVRTGRLRSDRPNLSNVPQGNMEVAKFPHCDDRILHAPGKCVYCDLYPEMQKERIEKKVSFTGEPPERGMFPCPAEQARSSENLNAWPGNRAQGYEEE